MKHTSMLVLALALVACGGAERGMLFSESGGGFPEPEEAGGAPSVDVVAEAAPEADSGAVSGGSPVTSGSGGETAAGGASGNPGAGGYQASGGAATGGSPEAGAGGAAIAHPVVPLTRPRGDCGWMGTTNSEIMCVERGRPPQLFQCAATLPAPGGCVAGVMVEGTPNTDANWCCPG